MGINCSPADNPIGVDCNVCFEADKTPLYIYARICGIEKTIYWNEFCGESPAGIHVFKQDSSCIWRSTAAGYPMYIWFKGTTVEVYFLSTKNAPCFFDERDGSCCDWFENTLPPNGPCFSGGSVQLAFCWPIKTMLSLPDVGMLLGIEYDPKTFADFFNKQATPKCVRFSRKKDATNLIIKLD